MKLETQEYECIVWYYEIDLITGELESGPIPEEISVITNTPWQARKVSSEAFDINYGEGFVIKDIDCYRRNKDKDKDPCPKCGERNWHQEPGVRKLCFSCYHQW